MLALCSLARQVPEKPCSGDAAKALGPSENLEQPDETKDRLRIQPWSLCSCFLTLPWEYKGLRACNDLAGARPDLAKALV